MGWFVLCFVVVFGAVCMTLLAVACCVVAARADRDLEVFDQPLYDLDAVKVCIDADRAADVVADDIARNGPLQ